jgi:hypothetical protein
VLQQFRKLPLLFHRKPICWTFKIQLYEGDVLEPILVNDLFHSGGLEKSNFFKVKITSADPFLIKDDNRLYVFFESQCAYSKGKIECISTENLKKWKHHGIVLEEPFHLSFPSVFVENKCYWMLPESSKSGSLWIYKTYALPSGWIKIKPLLDFPCHDPVLYKWNGIYYIWITDNQDKMRLFYSTSLLESYREHPMSPITKDPRYNRSGGAIMTMADNSLIRLAQDGETSYGRGLHAIRIKTLTPQMYEEEVIKTDFLPRDAKWNSLGTHHLHSDEFLGRKIRAVDGQGYASRIYTIPILVRRLAIAVRDFF